MTAGNDHKETDGLRPRSDKEMKTFKKKRLETILFSNSVSSGLGFLRIVQPVFGK